MRKRILAVFLALASLMCLLGGCGGTTTKDPKPSGETTNSSRAELNEITVGIAQDLDDSLDPYQMADAGTREVLFNVFEGLVKPDSDGNYVCAVASDYNVSDDGLVYTFTLRDGVVFHNGAACTTDDVLYSFETCAATSVTAAVVSALSAISEIKAEGSSIVITLSTPNPDFISYVSSVYIVPKDYTGHATQPVGTGPFKFVSHSIQENFIIERHDAYYGEGAKLNKVTYKVYEDITALYTALNSG
ncbi:MAG: ABC transporter substrate-binding protein, partial [Clostridia bacterium]|nr:ABC transporter substrate-binding protein [Clostridia bacterium]